jgi:cobalt-zinc-cadmium efflux system protein
VVRSCLKGLLTKEANLPSSEEIEKLILSTDHVESVHSVTISNIENQLAVGAHIVLKHHCTIDSHDQACREQVEHILNTEFGISQCVLQIESHNCPDH